MLEPWEIHPALVHFPIAFLLGAVVYDLYAWWRGDPGASRMWDKLEGNKLEDAWWRGDPGASRIATGLLWAGVGAAGVLAFFTGPASHTEESGQLIWWHIGAAVIQFLLFTVAAFVRWWAEPAAPPTWTRILGLVAAVILVYAGYVGGYIVYHGAAGIEPDLLAPQLHQKQIQKESKEGSGGQASGPRASAEVPRAPGLAARV
jgi:uncharacterized membrane protein